MGTRLCGHQSSPSLRAHAAAWAAGSRAQSTASLTARSLLPQRACHPSSTPLGQTHLDFRQKRCRSLARLGSLPLHRTTACFTAADAPPSTTVAPEPPTVTTTNNNSNNSNNTSSTANSSSCSHTPTQPQPQTTRQPPQPASTHERDPARLAAGLRWCAQQLVKGYEGAGANEAEALQMLQNHGVECVAHYANNRRVFCCPGSRKQLSKEGVARVLGLKKRSNAHRDLSHEQQQMQLRWCAQQLVSGYEGAGTHEQQALQFLQRHQVKCTMHDPRNAIRYFNFPGSNASRLSKDELAQALGLQRKGSSKSKQQLQAQRDQERQEGMRWLAEHYWNVYLVGSLVPGKATVEDVQHELEKMGVRCVQARRFASSSQVQRAFALAGSSKRFGATSLAKALGLKPLPGRTKASRQQSSNPQAQERGMQWLATSIAHTPSLCRLFGGVRDPQVVCEMLHKLGVFCSPTRKPSGYFNWRFKIKGRPGERMSRARLMETLFPGEAVRVLGRA